MTGKDDLGDILRVAEERLWTDFRDSGIFQHRGVIGAGREAALINFLNQRLPSRYKSAAGEIVDMGGVRSGQIDVLIYDASRQAPLLSREDGQVLIGVEAVLAAIEVKTTLTKDESAKIVGSLAKVQAMRPWGQDWARYRPRGEEADQGPRYFYSVLAYDSNLNKDNWATKELTRLREACDDAHLPYEYLDRVAVLTRGLILPAEGRVASVSDDSKSVLGWWYSALLNFMEREVDRRSAFPWIEYEHRGGQRWEGVLPPVFDAPEPKTYSRTQVKKYGRIGPY